MLAQAGTALNGRSDVQIRSPDPFGIDANRSGQIVFEARLQGSGVDLSKDPGSRYPIGNTNGLILYGPGGLDLIVEGGTTAPDGLGVFSQFFERPAINESGAILFRARVYDPVSQTFQSALFLRQPNGDLQTIAKQGDPVPGSTTGATISFPSEIALADDGTILFTASTSGRETVAIRIKDGIAHTLFKTGDQLDLGNGQFANLTFINVSRDLVRTGDDFILNAISRKPSVVDVSDPNNVTLTEVTDSYVLRSTLVEVDPDAVVPLPASVLLLMGGLGALGAVRIARRTRRAT